MGVMILYLIAVTIFLSRPVTAMLVPLSHTQEAANIIRFPNRHTLRSQDGECSVKVEEEIRNSLAESRVLRRELQHLSSKWATRFR